MLAKSYWPWLPFAIAGMVCVIRGRQRRLYILLIWFVVVLAMCAAAKSRVLRYMLRLILRCPFSLQSVWLR